MSIHSIRLARTLSAGSNDGAARYLITMDPLRILLSLSKTCSRPRVPRAFWKGPADPLQRNRSGTAAEPLSVGRSPRPPSPNFLVFPKDDKHCSRPQREHDLHSCRWGEKPWRSVAATVYILQMQIQLRPINSNRGK